MAIYRGPGGAGDATADSASEVLLVRELAIEVQADADAAEAAKAAALAAQTAAELAETNAKIAEANAETAENNSETAQAAAAVSAGDASTAATNAASSASAASTSATAASTSATNAASSATAAASSASSASSSAINANNARLSAIEYASASADSAIASNNSAILAASIYDDFDDRYLGSKSSNPTVDNDGDVLEDGALYFDTVNNVLKVFDRGLSIWRRTTPTTTEQTAINAVNDNSTNINTVATNIDSVNTNATNIVVIQNASANATAAATSATNASNSASAAATSATNAATSETNAANSATSASTSATNASNSASAASTSATNASNSATSASTSASTATTKASEASTSATNAASSASSASSNASTATTQAGIATTKASEAATSATNAASSASAASTSETNASNSASAAATSATNASNSASAADTSATNAATSASTSQAAADAALAALDSFDDRYLGQKSTAPTVDNDGNALITGALYFDTTDDAMKVWDGSNWLSAYASLSGALIATNNLSDLSSASTARTNLGLGTIATLSAPSGTVVGTSDTQTLTNKTLTSPVISGGTIDGATIGASSASSGVFTSLSDSGNLTFTGTGNRITGDFSNGTHSNRVLFQTSTTNANTIFGVIPNGTSSTSQLNLYNNADANNASLLQALTLSTDARLASGQVGTGSFLPLTMYTGGSERLRIDTSGNVGIGTSSPSGKLQVIGDVFISRSTTASDGAINFGSNTNNYIYAGNGNNLMAFATNGSERMRIDSSGNVGIGTSSPAGKLGVSDGTVQVITAPYGAGSTGYFGTSTNHTLALLTNNTECMRIDSSGTVLIGTTSTTASTFNPKLQIAAGSNSTTTIQGMPCGLLINNTYNGATTGQGISMKFQMSSGEVGKYAAIAGIGDGIYSNTMALAFYTTNNAAGGADNVTERMRINSAGNVGIGTSSPTAKLEVVGVGLFSNGTDNYVKVLSDNGAIEISRSAGDAYIDLKSADAEDFDCRIQSSGTTGILRFSTAGTERGAFDASGNFNFNSGYGSVATAYGCRAWVNFNGTGTVFIRASGNVSSITDNGTGNYTVNFTNAMSDADYAVSWDTDSAATTNSLDINTLAGSRATNSVGCYIETPGGSASDREFITMIVVR
jgi:hypothetical protein